jgi:hypothetical protein
MVSVPIWRKVEIAQDCMRGRTPFFFIIDYLARVKTGRKQKGYIGIRFNSFPFKSSFFAQKSTRNNKKDQRDKQETEH